MPLELGIVAIFWFIILFLIIVAQLVIGIIYWFKIEDLKKAHQAEVERMNKYETRSATLQKLYDQQSVQIQNVLSAVSEVTLKQVNMSLIDLAEFNKLDPYLKDAYRKYFVDMVMAQLLPQINQYAKENDLQTELATNGDSIEALINGIISSMDFAAIINDAATNTTN